MWKHNKYKADKFESGMVKKIPMRAKCLTCGNIWGEHSGLACPEEGDIIYDNYVQPDDEAVDNDPVNHPKHYTEHASGIECIQITEHMGFNLGNALKYIWRCDLKKDAIEDLEKAKWYIDRELKKRRDK